MGLVKINTCPYTKEEGRGVIKMLANAKPELRF